jgi:hypothetical protein
MGNLATQFGGKSAGELIRAEDWNGLIAGIEAGLSTLSASVDTRFGALDARVQALDSRLGQAEAKIANLRGDVEALLAQVHRVSLRAERPTYAVGELATVTARLLDTRGNPLTLADPAARPSIDFVSTWGRLLPASGFASLGGDGDRTISVQVNAQGEAAVLLRSEHAEGFTVEAEAQVAGSLSTVLPTTSIKVRDTLLAAATPMEASLRGAFEVMSREYDRTDAVNVRNYVDTYFVRNPGRVAGTLPPVTHDLWHDYRSTVLAFARFEAGGAAAGETGQGVGSIQVVFRDWIGPWLNLDYLPRANVLATQYRDLLRPRIGADFAATAAGLGDEIGKTVGKKGLVAKHRDYLALGTALEQLPAQGAPDYVRAAAASAQNAIGMQQTLESAQVTLGVPGEQVALSALTGVTLRAESSAAAARDTAAKALQDQVGQIQERVQTTVRTEQQAFRADLLREDGPVVTAQKAVESFRGQIGGFQAALAAKADLQVVTRFLPPAPPHP